MSEVTVTNTGKEELVDSYNGEVFRFAPGKTVTIPALVANHIFGWGEENKEPHLVRLGWVVTRNDLKKGLERLAKFRIEGEEYRSLSPAVERVPLAQSKRDGGKLTISSAA